MQVIAEKDNQKVADKPHKQSKPNIQAIIQSMKQNNPELYNDMVMGMFNGVGRRETGLYYTPDNIAELIASIGQIYNPHSVIDICCGTGTIINCFQDMEIVKGIDINANIIRLAKYINPAIDFIEADTTTYDFSNEKYDLVVGNLPFGARTPEKRPLEIELIKKGLLLLDNNGIAIFVVPEGLLTNSVSSEFRNEILSNFALDMVISLPIGIFPYMGVKTSILVLRNGDKKQDVFMPEFKDNSVEIANNFKNHKGGFYFTISKITDRLDRNYYLSIDSIEKTLGSHQRIKLADISEIIRGKYLKDFKSSGNYLVFNRQDKKGNNFVDFIYSDKYILKPNDIVICLKGINNKIDFYKHDGVKKVITDNYAIIRPVENYKYITTYLKTEDGLNLLRQQINRNLKGSAIKFINLSDLSNIEIPLLPLDELNELISKSIEINENKFSFLQEFSKHIKNKEYGYARVCITNSDVFKNANPEEAESLESLVEIVEDAEKKDKVLEEKNKRLELALEKEKSLYKELHEKEKEMLSFFTHTMRNALATAPESLRQAIRLLGSEDYEKNQKHYEAINEITALFSTITLTDCLIDTFKQSIYDTEEFKRAWQQDNTGDATPEWFIAAALRQSLNRIIFMEDATGLRKLINNQGELIKLTRKAFIEQVLPLDTNQRDVEKFYHWLQSITALEVNIEKSTLQFGANQIKFSLMFAISSELILNALKYWSGTRKIQIAWHIEPEHYIFSVKNACKANASSQLAGTHKGLAFINRLIELLGEQAQFNCTADENTFTAELKLHKTLLEGE